MMSTILFQASQFRGFWQPPNENSTSRTLGKPAPMRALLLVEALFIGWLSIAQTPAHAQDGNGAGPKRAYAVRIPNGSIRLDGHLNEAAWSEARPISDFL